MQWWHLCVYVCVYKLLEIWNLYKHKPDLKLSLLIQVGWLGKENLKN